MNRRQRFRSNNPCPVCGGHSGLPQGERRRCYGFLSDDGLYAHCTREEHAGNLARKPNSKTYAHGLQGPCGCGRGHGAASGSTSLRLGGAQSVPSIDSYQDLKLGKPTRLWPYWHADGELACFMARWDRPDGSKAIRPLKLENGRWRQRSIDPPWPLLDLPALVSRPDAPVLVVEGEKASEAAGKTFPSYVSTTCMFGAKSPTRSDWTLLNGREVVIWPDNDPDGQSFASQVALLAHKAGASEVRIVKQHKGLPGKWDLADPVPDGVDLQMLLADAEPYTPGKQEPNVFGIEEERVGRISPADQLLSWAMERVDLYSNGEESYADVVIDGKRETMAIRSKEFGQWLRRLCWELTGKAASKDALSRAMENLDAHAALGPQMKVYVRVASHDGKLYIDLRDDARQVVEIDAEGWRIQEGKPPVRFKRTPTMAALPVPEKGDAGEGIRALHNFLNVGDDGFVLCVAWLLSAMRDTGPFPLLILAGEQGAAKSTAARLLRSLVDPARAPIRGMPRDERDLVIAARRRHILAFDNLSVLPVWLSDTLCRLSTGEGYATRVLFTDDDEVVFEASRPVILTGIENPAVRGDLADRSVIVRLAPIADAARRTESELMDAFEEARPHIFAALLDGLSEGLRKFASVQLEGLPRMADFCKWTVACEGAFWHAGAFMAVYRDAQASATEDVLEESPIFPALRRYLEERGGFEGSAEELLKRLNDQRLDKVNDRGWPATGAMLSKQLIRLAPSLRKLGYTVEHKRKRQWNGWKLESPSETAGPE